MNSNKNVYIPCPASGIELRSLPIGPEEAFVLSRVDGHSSQSDIIASTGLDANRVEQALKRLASLGAIVVPNSVSRFAEVPTGSQAHPKSHAPDALSADTPSARCPLQELSEEVELSPRRRLCVLELFYRLDELTHYEILGVPETADRKEIKAAYYGVVNLFHPDRYYGKRLGSFKFKLETVFGSLTMAQETLSRARTRKEYDELLQGLGSRRAVQPGHREFMERLHATIREEVNESRVMSPNRSAPPNAEPLASRDQPIPLSIAPTTARTVAVSISATPHRPQTPIPTSRQSAAVISAAHAARQRLTAVRVSVAPSTQREVAVKRSCDATPSIRRPRLSSSSAPPTEYQSVPPEERRKALARHLRGSMPPSRPSRQQAVAEHTAGVADELKAEYTRRRSVSQQQQLQRYLDAATEAAEAGLWVAASNAIRVAATIAPNDDAVAKRLGEYNQLAAEQMSGTYVDRAREYEKNGLMAAAASNYEKAARGNPSASLFTRSAKCLLAGDGDLKHAAELAKQALRLNEEHIEAHVTLARIYAVAGMRTSALMELERAAGLAPGDASITDLLKKLKRGDT